MTDGGWDDERLAAAFHARFDRPAPRAVASSVHAALTQSKPPRAKPFRWIQAGAAVAAAVIVAVVGVGVVGRGGLGPSDSPAPTTGSAGPTASPAPTSVFGLRVGTVSDALAIRDGGIDDRELAVAGWFTPAPPLGCPAPPTHRVSPVQLWCPDEAVLLVEPPSGRTLNPDLDDLDPSWEPIPPMLGNPGESTPAHVVMLGHFDDRRSILCPAAEVVACRDRFVVDRVHWVDGRFLPTSLQNELDGIVPRSSLAAIEAIVRGEAPDSPLLSMAIVDGATGLARIEPALGTGRRGLIDQAALWIVRVLESERISTYAVVDGTNAIYELTEDGDAVPVGGSVGPPASTAAWPPAGSIVIALTSFVVAGQPPAQVAVVDESGRLVGVAEKGTVDPANVPVDGRFGAYAEPGIPGRVHLTWTGGICDSHITVTVAADLGSITFDMGPQPDCDTIGVGRELVLDFAGTVEVPTIELGEATATPTPSARAYELDCGTLRPDTCEQWAAAIVAATTTASPTKHVDSITFTDECGSYTLLYDDGTGAGADIDCIPQASGAS